MLEVRFGGGLGMGYSETGPKGSISVLGFEGGRLRVDNRSCSCCEEGTDPDPVAVAGGTATYPLVGLSAREGLGLMPVGSVLGNPSSWAARSFASNDWTESRFLSFRYQYPSLIFKLMQVLSVLMDERTWKFISSHSCSYHACSCGEVRSTNHVVLILRLSSRLGSAFISAKFARFPRSTPSTSIIDYTAFNDLHLSDRPISQRIEAQKDIG